MVTLAVAARNSEALDELTVEQLVGLIAQAGALLAQRAADRKDALRPLLDIEQAAPLFGLHPETLRRRVKSDAAFRACTVDNGTDRVVFDPAKIEAFRRRRAG